uniref:Ribosome biogenesis protein NOP53 n=1 Tax=Caenorhabditis japonica TaxID=281687 RepID=A0A8R1HHS1_CAEJA
MDEWKQSFREIYGRSPTPGDISIAPNHVKEAMKAEQQKAQKECDLENSKQPKRGVKRKNFEMKMMDDEQFSPIKKRINLKKDENFPVLLRTSPRKKLLSLDDSPMKPFSPKKKVLSGGADANFCDLDDFSPMKTFGTSAVKLSAAKNGLTPIKSPTKKVYQRQLFNRDLEMLLLPTPEKRDEAEDDDPAEEFDDETNEEVATAKAQKPVMRRLSGSTKKNDQNFQKINLRKKQFVRGKVTAEQKRKMKRKQMFKRKN